MDDVWNTPREPDFDRVVKLFKKKKTGNVKATKKLEQAKITKLELEFIQNTCDTLRNVTEHCHKIIN